MEKPELQSAKSTPAVVAAMLAMQANVHNGKALIRLGYVLCFL
jgi:hypothetical protein